MHDFILVAALSLSGIAVAIPAGSATAAGMAFIPQGRFTLPFRSDGIETRIRVEAFHLDRHAVTQNEFRDFVKANPGLARSRIQPMFADPAYLAGWKDDSTPQPHQGNMPVTRVSWYAAKAYCACRGKRLPTTVEWEWAAKALPPGMDSAALDRAILDWYGEPSGRAPDPVGSGLANGYGVRDLFGLVWEWTSDFDAFGAAGTIQGGPADSAFFCGAGGAAAIKDAGYATYMRWAFRASLRPQYSIGSLGFRCARGPEKEGLR